LLPLGGALRKQGGGTIFGKGKRQETLLSTTKKYVMSVRSQDGQPRESKAATKGSKRRGLVIQEEKRTEVDRNAGAEKDRELWWKGRERFTNGVPSFNGRR